MVKVNATVQLGLSAYTILIPKGTKLSKHPIKQPFLKKAPRFLVIVLMSQFMLTQTNKTGRPNLNVQRNQSSDPYLSPQIPWCSFLFQIQDTVKTGSHSLLICKFR